MNLSVNSQTRPRSWELTAVLTSWVAGTQLVGPSSLPSRVCINKLEVEPRYPNREHRHPSCYAALVVELPCSERNVLHHLPLYVGQTYRLMCRAFSCWDCPLTLQSDFALLPCWVSDHHIAMFLLSSYIHVLLIKNLFLLPNSSSCCRYCTCINFLVFSAAGCPSAVCSTVNKFIYCTFFPIITRSLAPLQPFYMPALSVSCPVGLP